MKVLFAGPSLHGLSPDLSGLIVRGPAMHGDIARAVIEGATAIGLVDGNFEAVAAVWHKEILLALSEGVAVLGSSSMGALRAAECAPFGMKSIGVIANAYASGDLDDDAAVALTHAPAELEYVPLTEPLVDVKPSLDRLLTLGLLSPDEHRDLWQEACSIYFKERTDEAIFANVAPNKLAAYREHRVNQKAEDALLLITALRRAPPRRASKPDLAMTSSFFTQRILPGIARSVAAAANP